MPRRFSFEEINPEKVKETIDVALEDKEEVSKQVKQAELCQQELAYKPGTV